MRVAVPAAFTLESVAWEDPGVEMETSSLRAAGVA
jgi:hypothetical protein